MKLRAYLQRRGESDEAFAERAGISRATVKRIHASGEARSAAVVYKIVQATANAVKITDLIKPPPSSKGKAA